MRLWCRLRSRRRSSSALTLTVLHSLCLLLLLLIHLCHLVLGEFMELLFICQVVLRLLVCLLSLTLALRMVLRPAWVHWYLVLLDQHLLSSLLLSA